MAENLFPQYNYEAPQPAKIKLEDLGAFSKRIPPSNLETQQFATKCPPSEVNQRVQIIAVAGPTDIGNNAHPEADGWFLSDFYLAHHLFNRLLAIWGDKSSPRVNQKWLTCVEPKTLVEKYTVFAHGNKDDRRVVLDQNMLEVASKAVYVTKPEDLRSTFLSTVKKTCEECAKEDRPVLILMFGHGNKATGGVYIGIDDDESGRGIRTVKAQEIAEAVGSHADKTTILSTACYSGQWSKDPKLKTATMTAALPQVESLAQSAFWIANQNYGPFCGSRFLTALRLTLEATEKIEGNSEHTFASFMAHLRWSTSNQVDDGKFSTMSCAARKDAWEDPWWKQSTLPLLYTSWNMSRATFQQAWEALSPYKGNIPLPSPLSALPKKSILDAQSLDNLRKTAQKYLDSHPGSPNLSGNTTAYSECQRVKVENKVALDVGNKLRSMLEYRLNKIMTQATAYKYQLGLQRLAEDCNDFDCNEKQTKMQEAKDSEKGRLRVERYDTVFKSLVEARLFPEPTLNEGHSYDKGEAYLAFVIVEAVTERVWEMDDVPAKITALTKSSKI